MSFPQMVVSATAIRSIRVGQGISRAKLARAAQLDASQLWRIETGKATPRDDTLGRLAQALNVPVTSLLAPADA